MKDATGLNSQPGAGSHAEVVSYLTANGDPVRNRRGQCPDVSTGPDHEPPSHRQRDTKDRRGIGVELHSEGESFRRAHVLRAADGSSATVLVLRRGSDVWLTFSGAVKMSVLMSCAETDELIDTLCAARGRPR